MKLVHKIGMDRAMKLYLMSILKQSIIALNKDIMEGINAFMVQSSVSGNIALCRTVLSMEILNCCIMAKTTVT